MFADVVKLYRESGRPPLAGALFRYNGPLVGKLQEAIETCSTIASHFGRFQEEPEFDGHGNVEFCWLCGANEHGRFYLSIAELVERSQSVHRGLRPSAFYLIDENYLVDEQPESLSLQRLYDVCELIQLLSKISVAGDASGDTSQPKSLVFVLPAGDKTPPRTIRLPTKISTECLSGGRLDLELLRGLVDDQNDNKLHIQEHRSLFRLAIADVAAASDEMTAFCHLVSNWPKVLEKYHFDADCYISNFSFDKFRSEVAATQSEYSSKLTRVMADSASRFLALPLPYVALVGIINTDEIGQAYVIFLGALIVTLLYSGMVHNQLLELRRIVSSFDLVFSRLEKQAKTTSQVLSSTVSDARRAFNEQRSFLKRTLYILRTLAVLPLLGGLGILAFKFHPGFHDWLLSVPK